MTSALAEAHQMTLEMEKAKALEKLTQRVAHDLGSPLMSLNSCIAKLDQVPENIRLMAREAIIRINDNHEIFLIGIRLWKNMKKMIIKIQIGFFENY